MERNMYAVVATGGKQYRVEAGQELQVELLPADIGEAVVFDQVLLVSDGEKSDIGKPNLQGVTVKAEVLAQERAKKVEIIKFKRRKHHMKHQGHRQYLTRVKILEVAGAKLA